MDRGNESPYQQFVIVEGDKYEVKLKEAKEVRIHANETKDIVGEEALVNYGSVRRREKRVKTVALLITMVLERELLQSSIESRDQLFEASSGGS